MYLTIDEIARRVDQLMECSQSEMAERIDVSQATVSQALNGEMRQRKTLFKIARELGCQVDDTFHFLFKLPSERK